MNAYVLQSVANNYRCLVPVDEQDWKLFTTFDGEHEFKDSWKPIEMQPNPDQANTRDQSFGDFPSIGLSNAPIFSERAILALGNAITPFGEILPLICGNESFYAVNVTEMREILDPLRSDIERFESSSRIMNVETYALLECSELPAIFKIPATAAADVLVSEEFRKLVNDGELEGFNFVRTV